MTRWFSRGMCAGPGSSSAGEYQRVIDLLLALAEGLTS